MATRTEQVRSPYLRQASDSEPGANPASRVAWTHSPSRYWLLLICLAALFLTQPAVQTVPYPPLWFPAAGITLAMVAWFGPRAVLIELAAGAMAGAFVVARGGNGAEAVAAAADGAVGALEAVTGCWFFLNVARAGRRLGDPRSAVEFVLLVPGFAAALGAACRAVVAAGCGVPLTVTGITGLWLGHALGLLVVAPPLLVCLTPWLLRHGFTAEDVPDAAPLLPGPVGADRLTFGDIVEIAGLAFCAGGLGLILALAPGHRVLAGWQTWGAPLLLIVWASLRQGLPGGTSVACAAVAVPLAVLMAATTPVPLILLLQGNLLAQAGTGLLVAASASWLRSSERRYRQLVAHVPVVVYSVRLAGNPPTAEVTLVSAASIALLGCPPDRFLGDHRLWLEHVHPDDREVLLAAIAQLQRQDGPVTCEYRLAPEIPPIGRPRASRRFHRAGTPASAPGRIAPASGGCATRWPHNGMPTDGSPAGKVSSATLPNSASWPTICAALRAC